MNLISHGQLLGISPLLWISLLVDLIVKGSLVLVIAFLLTGSLARYPAALRSRIWTVGFVLMLLVPVTTIVHSCYGDSIARNCPDWVPAGIVLTMNEQADDQANPTMQATSDRANLSGTISDPAPGIKDTVQPVINDRTRPGLVIGQTWTVLVLIWLSGVVVLIGRMILRMTAESHALQSACRPAGEKVETLVQACARELGLSGKVIISCSSTITVPFVTGLIRKRLVLPTTMCNWPRQKLQTVIRHELAHLARHDIGRLVMGHFVGVLYWFNPLIWRAGNKAQLEMEMASDDIACGNENNNRVYARQLLGIASAEIGARDMNWSPGLARRSGLEIRVLNIMSSHTNDRRGTMWMRILSAGFGLPLVLLLLGFGLVEPDRNSLQQPVRPPVVSTVDENTPRGITLSPGIGIHQAADTGDLEQVKRLLADEPAALDLADDTGMTPLARAAWNGHLDTVEYLLLMGADPDRKNNNGLTPLFCAVDRDRAELTRLLISHGADYSISGFRNRSLLHMTARCGDLTTARFLIDNGLDVNARDAHGVTPLDLARSNSHHAVIQVLSAAGAQTGAGVPKPRYKNNKQRPAVT